MISNEAEGGWKYHGHHAHVRCHVAIGRREVFFFRALSGALCHAKGLERDGAIVAVVRKWIADEEV